MRMKWVARAPARSVSGHSGQGWASFVFICYKKGSVHCSDIWSSAEGSLYFFSTTQSFRESCNKSRALECHSEWELNTDTSLSWWAQISLRWRWSHGPPQDDMTPSRSQDTSIQYQYHCKSFKMSHCIGKVIKIIFNIFWCPKFYSFTLHFWRILPFF